MDSEIEQMEFESTFNDDNIIVELPDIEEIPTTE
jgi:hypothetical protein